MPKSKRGKHNRVKEVCPDCGKTAYLKLHKKYCPGRPEPEPEPEPEPNIVDTIDLRIPETDKTILITGDNEEMFLDFDSDIIENISEGAKKVGKSVKKVVRDSTIINETGFRGVFLQLNKLFDVMGMPVYKLTEDEIDLISPDLYYLLRKYYPDVLKWLNNDFVIAGRLILNVISIARTKIIMAQLLKGDIDEKTANTLLSNMLDNNPEFTGLKSDMSGIGEALKEIAKMKKNEIENQDTPDNKTKQLAVYNHG